MSAAEERFIAGEGPLAALIRAQPGFEAPPRMLGQILAALEATPASAGFESPASLLDAVMTAAERIDTAQAPRRDALLAELATGKSASDALGAPVSPATAAWLAQQPRGVTTPPVRRRRWPWLAGLGTAVTAALAVSVALRVVQESAAPPPMPTTMAESATAGIAGTADQTLALAPRPRESAERFAMTEAPSSATAARARSSLAQQPEARRVAPAAPVAEPSKLTEALRDAPTLSARLHAEADTDTPAAPISAPLDTPPATLATRLLAQPARAWTLTVAPPDAAAGKALATALAARLKADGRDDVITTATGPVAPGSVRITPTDF